MPPNSGKVQLRQWSTVSSMKDFSGMRGTNSQHSIEYVVAARAVRHAD